MEIGETFKKLFGKGEKKKEDEIPSKEELMKRLNGIDVNFQSMRPMSNDFGVTGSDRIMDTRRGAELERSRENIVSLLDKHYPDWNKKSSKNLAESSLSKNSDQPNSSANKQPV